MNRLLLKAQNEIEHLGERPLYESDFYRECAKRSFEVVEVPLSESKGMTIWALGRVVIVINANLHGRERLEVMWHEFGHAWMHAPAVSVGALFCGVQSRMTDEQERETEEFVSWVLSNG